MYIFDWCGYLCWHHLGRQDNCDALYDTKCFVTIYRLYCTFSNIYTGDVMWNFYFYFECVTANIMKKNIFFFTRSLQTKVVSRVPIWTHTYLLAIITAVLTLFLSLKETIGSMVNKIWATKKTQQLTNYLYLFTVSNLRSYLRF